MTTRVVQSNWVRMGVPIVAGALALAACSSSGGKKGGGSPTTGGSATGGGGAPINVMIEGSFAGSTNPSFGNVPEARDGTKAYFDAINKAGGINGHKVKYYVCNDQSSPDLAAKCARDAVSKKVVAVFAAWHAANGPAILPILEPAHIAFLNSPLSPQDYTSPVSFVVGSGATGAFAATALGMLQSGCKKLGMFNYDIAAAQGLVVSTKAAVKPKGASIGTVTVSPTASTFADVVSRVQSAGYDCMIPVIAPAQVVPLMQALKAAGVSIKVGGFAANYTADELKQISANGGNGSVYSSSYTTAGDDPALTQMKADLAADKVPVMEFSIAGWTEARIFGEVAKKMTGAYTAQTVLDALNKADNIDVGTLPPFSTQHPVTVKGYTRVFTPIAYVNVLKDGKMTPLQTEPVDITAAYGSS